MTLKMNPSTPPPDTNRTVLVNYFGRITAAWYDPQDEVWRHDCGSYCRIQCQAEIRGWCELPDIATADLPPLDFGHVRGAPSGLPGEAR